MKRNKAKKRDENKKKKPTIWGACLVLKLVLNLSFDKNLVWISPVSRLVCLNLSFNKNLVWISSLSRRAGLERIQRRTRRRFLPPPPASSTSSLEKNATGNWTGQLSFHLTSSASWSLVLIFADIVDFQLSWVVTCEQFQSFKREIWQQWWKFSFSATALLSSTQTCWKKSSNSSFLNMTSKLLFK